MKHKGQMMMLTGIGSIWGLGSPSSRRLPAEKHLEQADPDPVSFPLTQHSRPPYAEFCDAEAARASAYNYSSCGCTNTAQTRHPKP